MTTDQNQIEILDARRAPVRVGLAAAVLLALVFGWFAARWQFGDMLGELTNANDPNAKEIGALAVRLAPGDPRANWLLAGTRKNLFAPDAIIETAKSFETVARLAPNDYRWWIELGRAREQSEQFGAAEAAYRRALELSPNYTYTHWQTGNFYLRQNRSDEAFAELKKAAANNSPYRDQVFSIAWDYYDKDTARLDAIAGDAPNVRAGLARFYAGKERAADSLRIWNTLSAEEKETNAPTARTIALAFYDKKFYRYALEFVRSLGIEPEARFEFVQNGGFEQPIGDVKETYFGWKRLPVDKIEVRLDPTQKHEGSRSLRVAFSGYAEPSLYNIYQYVAVEASANYRLTFWVRTENLKSGGTPAIEIYNANEDKTIVTSEAFPTGTNDWQQVELKFAAPPNIQAVSIRTARQFCGANCPIFGSVWYDDFKLERMK